MRQLSSLDAQFLALETPRQSGHVGSVAILDPSTRPTGTLALSNIEELIAERLSLLPPLQWRIQEVPLGLDYPYWIDDRDFDLDFHVRELALAAPGADTQLAEQVARIVARPLDRSRPLWELYLISGLASGHVAMLTKIHHALVDGLSGAEIMGLLLDLAPTGRELPAPEDSRNDESAPGQLGMLARGLRGIPRYPLRALRSIPAAAPESAGNAVQCASGRECLRRCRQARRARDHRCRGPRPRARAARRSEDELQRARLRPPAVRLRPAQAR